MWNKLYTRIERIQLNDDGEFSLGRAHKRIKETFGKVCSAVIGGKEDDKIRYSKKQLEELAQLRSGKRRSKRSGQTRKFLK